MYACWSQFIGNVNNVYDLRIIDECPRKKRGHVRQSAYESMMLKSERV